MTNTGLDTWPVTRSTTGNLVWPKNVTPILLPSRSPELNPVEQVWQFLRANYLSNRVFDDFDAIIDAACDAWRKLIAQPQQITSIGMRTWAHEGHSGRPFVSVISEVWQRLII